MKWTSYRKIQLLIIGVLLLNFLAVEVTLLNYLQDVNGYLSPAFKIITALMTVILIIGIGASFVVKKRLTLPLVRLKHALDEATSEQNMASFEEVGDNELNVFVKEYHHMANHINTQRDKIRELAFSDELTGLANRNQFVLEVKKQIENNGQIALFYVDLDNFKYINDTYGHTAGDLVLTELGERFKGERHRNNVIARLGGDEFGVSIEGLNSEKDVQDFAVKILAIVSEPIAINQFVFDLTASIGISRYPHDALSYAELLTNADVAMYSAKSDGKDGYVLFNPEIHNSVMEEMNVETHLIDAVRKGEIFPLFQPLVRLSTGQIDGFEALVRWTDKELGPVIPEVFIPIAERNLSIIPLGWHILEAAVAFGKRLYDIYEKYFEINVNVSVIQLNTINYVEGVMEILEKYNYPAKYLNLEITESLTLESNKHLMLKLAILRKQGIRISLDDFGTGYSSLSHLTDLSLSQIKVDRQLIIKAKQSREVFLLMKGIVKFAHIMGYEVVAEGVEDITMERLVLEMEADFGQGYMYARPMTEEDIHILLGID